MPRIEPREVRYGGAMFDQDEIDLVMGQLQDPQGLVPGPRVAEFERRVAEYMETAGEDEMVAQSRTYLGIAEARLGHRDEAEALFREAVPALPTWNAETPLLLRQVIEIFEGWNTTGEPLVNYRELLARSEREVASASN